MHSLFDLSADDQPDFGFFEAPAGAGVATQEVEERTGLRAWEPEEEEAQARGFAEELVEAIEVGEVTAENFGYVVPNDWPLEVAAKFKLAGKALDQWYVNNSGRMPVFRTERAASKMIARLFREWKQGQAQAVESPAVEIVYPELANLDRNDVIKRIKAALQKRSGKAWSVTGGRGTAWGWITIDAPPSRRTWHSFATGEKDDRFNDIYREEDRPDDPTGYTGPDDRAELAKLLGMDSVHFQGVSVPSSNDHYREYIDRAEGRPPRKIAERYWD